MPRRRSAPPRSRRCWRANRPQSPKLINTCYSLAAPEYGIFDRRRLPSGRRQARRCRGRGRDQPARRAARDSARGGAARRSLVPHDHCRSLRLNGEAGWRGAPSLRRLGCCSARRRSGGGHAARAVRDRRRRDPGIADRRRRRPGARPRDRRRPPGRAVPAVPYRPVPGAASARHAGAGPGGRRIAAVAGSASPAARRCHAAQPGHDHAALLPDRGSRARRACLCRQADPRPPRRSRTSLPFSRR